MLLWELITIGALIIAVALWRAYVITVRRHRLIWARGPQPEIYRYLDEDYAMDLYLQGDYPYLQRSVQETLRRKYEGKAQISPPSLGAGVAGAVEKEQIIEYFEEVGPTTVIGRIIRALDDANDIVYVDLLNGRIAPSVGLDRALRPAHGWQAKQVRAARLRELESAPFVSVEGRFRVTSESATTSTFSAFYGDPKEVSDDLPKVSVTCANDKLRHNNVPNPPFRARCLGKIRWDPGTRELEISPVLAIFH
jgi:hypothetical protein